MGTLRDLLKIISESDQEISQRKEQLNSQWRNLITQAPKSLEKYFAQKKESILRHLTFYGRHEEMFFEDNLEEYGFKSFKDAEEQFGVLREIWENEIEIKIVIERERSPRVVAEVLSVIFLIGAG